MVIHERREDSHSSADYEVEIDRQQPAQHLDQDVPMGALWDKPEEAAVWQLASDVF